MCLCGYGAVSPVATSPGSVEKTPGRVRYCAKAIEGLLSGKYCAQSLDISSVVGVAAEFVAEFNVEVKLGEVDARSGLSAVPGPLPISMRHGIHTVCSQFTVCLQYVHSSGHRNSQSHPHCPGDVLMCLLILNRM